jgi:hypothetical protein
LPDLNIASSVMWTAPKCADLPVVIESPISDIWRYYIYKVFNKKELLLIKR